MGRGAVNQKGPEAAFLAALHAIRGAGKKMPVNLVLVAEGEEEIGSPHFPQIVARPRCAAALRNAPASSCRRRRRNWMAASRSRSARRASSNSSSSRAARSGDAAREATSTRATARVLDSPAWHLVQALATLVDATATRRSKDSRTRRVRRRRPRSAMIARLPRRIDEGTRRSAGRRSTGFTTVSWRRIARDLDVAADREHRGARRRGTRDPVARPSCRTGRWRSSICGSCPT